MGSRNYVAQVGDIESARGVVYLVGKFVTASVGGTAPGASWTPQKPRKAGKGKMPGAAGIGIAIHSVICKGLQKNKMPDVRIAYDGYIEWVLNRKEDCSLIAGVADSEYAWLTVITKKGGVIEAIRESEIDYSDYGDPKDELEKRIRTLCGSHANVFVAVDGLSIDQAFENLGDEPLSLAKRPAKLGHMRVPRACLYSPYAALLAALPG